MIFVDSGAFFALYVTADSRHAKAVAWLGNNAERLITTDYVAAETLNLLRARRQGQRSEAPGEVGSPRAVTRPRLPHIRTCAINASGSS